MTTVIESYRISPPADVAGELVVPLSFFDILWLPFPPLRFLLFYEYPCSEASFLESLVPKLKESLSLTLKHYLPVAGNLLYPSDTTKKPVLRYATGDSVCLTIAKSSHDFGELIGNHVRDADQFYDFVPPMSPAAADHDHPEYRTVPLLALQVTLFPGRGICLGLALHHCLGDMRSIQAFLLAWASMYKDGRDVCLPTFDRSVIQDAYGIIAIEEAWRGPDLVELAPSFPIPTKRVRATFTLRECDINKLKAKAKPAAASSFVVTTSYIWSCLAKSGSEVQSRLLLFPADARRLTNPPVPANYFGNCLASGVVILEHKKLAGDEGFVTAAGELADAVGNLVKNFDKDECLKHFKDAPPISDEIPATAAVLGVGGSPRFDLGAADFGWGKLRSQELLSQDEEKYAMFLSKSADSEEGGLDVGLTLPREDMEAFAAVFADGLARL